MPVRMIETIIASEYTSAAVSAIFIPEVSFEDTKDLKAQLCSLDIGH